MAEPRRVTSHEDLWFADPVDSRFARASRRGSWTPESLGACQQCGTSRQRRARPLILEAKKSGKTFDKKVYKRALKKQVQNEKVEKQRDKQRRESQTSDVNPEDIATGAAVACRRLGCWGGQLSY